MRCALFVPVLLLTIAAGSAAGQKITKETLEAGGEQRTYYLFVPELVHERRAPLIVTLHGSNRDGKILLEHWQGLARKEGIILAGPDARQRAGWNVQTDGPQFLHSLVEAIKSRHPVDDRRVYLFGHSAGAIHGLHTAVLESEYFAAAAAHAGLLMDEYIQFLDTAPRKIPLALWVGTNDRLFPVSAVRATRDLLAGHKFPVELTEISGHTHDYYGRSGFINKAVWAFLRQQQLTVPPKYQQYEVSK